MKLAEINALRGKNVGELEEIAREVGVPRPELVITPDALRLAIIDAVCDRELSAAVAVEQAAQTNPCGCGHGYPLHYGLTTASREGCMVAGCPCPAYLAADAGHGTQLTFAAVFVAVWVPCLAFGWYWNQNFRLYVGDWSDFYVFAAVGFLAAVLAASVVATVPP